ncbi:MAG TPA: ASPIC/UnbV domain-containing protein, partial [Flavobacteriales bacterium]|nr:ASPIC/UnbV domain-containing protein [Flavobacteriales bacterium]
GLGSATVVDSAIVRWPSGTVDKYYGLQADQWVTVHEGETRTALVAAKVLLDGPFVSGTGMMKDDLRVQGLIPATEPYTAMGFAAIGDGLGRELTAAVLAVTGNNAIVDWVWLELRSASNLSNVVAARAVLLQRDGDVVELDGKSPVNMHVPPGNYHLAIRHRNHLGVLTAAASSLSGNATVIDLSSSATATWGTNARKSAGTARTLWSGDTNRDGTVKYTGVGNDRDKVLSTIGGAGITGTLSGYHLGDANMNGVVSYTGQSNDRDLILVNIGGVSPTAVLMEQLP